MVNRAALLPHRGILEIQGEDKASFLQGLISNDIQKVGPGLTIYAALLTSHGRFLYDFFIGEREESYFLETEAARLDGLLKRLNLYKLRSRVTLTPRPDLKVYALWGKDISQALGLKNELGSTQGPIFMDPRLVDLGARAQGEIAFKEFCLASPDEYDHHRLTLGIPEGGVDLIPEKSIPLEVGLDDLHAISWKKGCYVGQELTARTKHQGLVRKRLFPVVIEGPSPSFGDSIFKNEERVGEMRSHAGSQGLALLRLESLKSPGDFKSIHALLKPFHPLWMQAEETYGGV